MNTKIQILFSKQLALVAAKFAPLLGVFVILSSLEADGQGFWTETWRIAMSVGLAIFVSLVGMIYQNLNHRLEELETAAKNDFVPRREYDTRHGDLVKQLDRIEANIARKR